jgi:hypothetical protein
MATATKRAMATNGNNTGSGYSCPSSSAAAAAAVGKDDKGGCGLFLYDVVVKKLVCAFSQFLSLARRPSVWTAFLFLPYSKSWVSTLTVLFVAQIKVPHGTFICATNRILQKIHK